MPKQIQKTPQARNPLTTRSTSELPIAAFLKSRGIPLVDVSKANNGRVSWIFNLDSNEESALIHEYHTGGLVEAVKFFSELRNLKAMTYSA